MQWTALADAPLELTREALECCFEPFVVREVTADDPEWRRMLRVRKQRIVLKGLRRMMLGWAPGYRRDTQGVVAEYSKVWADRDYQRYSVYPSDLATDRPSPWEWHGRRMLAHGVGATRVRQLILIRLIEALRPRRVLEIGCGNGINLMLIAGRFPTVEFTGVELTRAGHAAARTLQQRERLPSRLTDFAPLELGDPTAFRAIEFQRGDATALALPDAGFDLVYTVLALEQMERRRDAALAEVARVSARHVFNVEPFRDVNEHGWERLNVLRRGYFQGRIRDLEDHGLEPALAFADFPQERFLKTCAVLSTKSGQDP